jgi:hypothetical protein
MPAKDLVELSEIILKFSPHCELKENVNNTIAKNFRTMPLESGKHLSNKVLCDDYE